MPHRARPQATRAVDFHKRRRSNHHAKQTLAHRACELKKRTGVMTQHQRKLLHDGLRSRLAVFRIEVGALGPGGGRLCALCCRGALLTRRRLRFGLPSSFAVEKVPQIWGPLKSCLCFDCHMTCCFEQGGNWRDGGAYVGRTQTQSEPQTAKEEHAEKRRFKAKEVGAAENTRKAKAGLENKHGAGGRIELVHRLEGKAIIDYLFDFCFVRALFSDRKQRGKTVKGRRLSAGPPGVGEEVAHRRLRAVNARLPEQRELQQARGERALRGDCEKVSPAPHIIYLHAAPRSSSGTRRDLARASRRTKATPSGSHRPPTSRPRTSRRQRRLWRSSG